MCTGSGAQGRALGDITIDVNNAAEPAAEPAAKKVRGKETYLPREGRSRAEALWKALMQLAKQAAKVKLVAGSEMFALVVSRLPNGAFDPGSVQSLADPTAAPAPGQRTTSVMHEFDGQHVPPGSQTGRLAQPSLCATAIDQARYRAPD